MNDMDYELANIIEVIGFLEDNNIEKEIPITFLMVWLNIKVLKWI